MVHSTDCNGNCYIGELTNLSSLEIMTIFIIKKNVKKINKKLSCRRDAARCFVLFNILLSHSRSLKMVPLETLGTVSYSLSIATMAVSLAVSTQYTNVTDARQTDRHHTTA